MPLASVRKIRSFFDAHEFIWRVVRQKRHAHKEDDVPGILGEKRAMFKGMA